MSTIDKVLQELNRFFKNESRNKIATLEQLEMLSDEIEVMMESLRMEIQKSKSKGSR